MKPEQNGWYFADDIFKYILLDFFIIHQNHMPNWNKSALPEVMAWPKWWQDITWTIENPAH